MRSSLRWSLARHLRIDRPLRLESLDLAVELADHVHEHQSRVLQGVGVAVVLDRRQNGLERFFGGVARQDQSHHDQVFRDGLSGVETGAADGEGAKGLAETANVAVHRIRATSIEDEPSRLYL